MKVWTLRLGLSLMVALGFWADRLPAQTVVTMTNGEQILVVPTVPYEPAHHYPNAMPFAPRNMPGPASHHLQHLMNQHGMGCKENTPWGCCGNFHSDFRFIFGSCRSFFGENCDPNTHNCGDKRWKR